MMALASRKAIQLLIILFGIVSLFTGNASAAKKVALVIGTDQYQNLPVLQKAVNDARAITETLSDIGFEVIKGENLTRRQMNRSLANLERTISPGDQVFFFFAGHGVALGATNYLIPADMPLPDAGEESLVRGEAFAVDRIVERIQARGASASFVVLDACRNNPFKTKGVRSIGSTRGLRDISTPKGVFVLFSAGIGQTALDRLHDGDSNPNSVFTRNLVPLLRKPGLSHVQLAKQVQSDVDKLARTIRHEQQPAYYDQVIGNMYLVEPAKTKKIQTEKKQQKIVRKQPPAKNNLLNNQLQTSQAERAFGLISNSENLSLLNAFVKKYPDSFHASIITARIEELNTRKIKVEADKQKAISEPGVNNRLAKLKEAERKWALLKSSSNIGALKQFAKDFSDTAFGSIAESRIDLLGELTLLEETKKQSANNNSLNSGEARIQSAIDQWKRLKTSRNLKDLTDFAEKYPELVYANLAIARVEELRNKIKKRQQREAQKKLDDDALRAWAGLKNSLNEQKLRAFSRKYSTTRFETLAKNRLSYVSSSAGRADAKWRNIAWSTNITVLKEFIREYPTSARTSAASKRIGELAEAQGDTNFRKKNYSEAFRLYNQALDHGNKNREVNFFLGYLYDDGKGVKKDYAEAARFYKIASEKGSAGATYNLALLYEYGRGVSRSYNEAARLYKIAADNNEGNASYNLAILYHNGKGVSRDYKKSASLAYTALRLKVKFALKQLTKNKKTFNKQFRRELQRKMKQEGYYKGAIDGSFGPATIAAINKVSGK